MNTLMMVEISPEIWINPEKICAVYPAEGRTSGWITTLELVSGGRVQLHETVPEIMAALRRAMEALP